MRCEICGKEYANLGHHTKYTHNMAGQEYYDKYVKQEDEGSCEVCGKPTAFLNTTVGYRNCCSIQCSSVSKSRVEKTKKTNRERYGVENAYSIPRVKEKAQKNSHTKEAHKKQWQTRREKYEIDPLHTEETKQKAKAGIRKSKRRSVEKFLKRLYDLEQENDCLGTNKLINIYGQGWLKIKDQLQMLHLGQYSFVKNVDIPKIEEYSNTFHGGKSNVEDDVFNFIATIYSGEILRRTRKVISPYELDIYIPDKKLAIEVDGIYWHSYNLTNDPNCMLYKTERCESLDIQLIHITDYEWHNYPEICKSIICAALNIFSEKIYARKCVVKQVTNQIAKDFLIANHLQGYVRSSYNFGLFYQDTLIQLISLGKSRFKANEYELLRFCTKLNTRVIGGFSKLLKYQPFDEIISYIDRSKFSGKGYFKANFAFVNYTKPSYSYYYNQRKLNRISCQKHKLENILGDKFDKSKTESQNMIDAGWLKVYDCGTMKVRWTR